MAKQAFTPTGQSQVTSIILKMIENLGGPGQIDLHGMECSHGKKVEIPERTVSLQKGGLAAMKLAMLLMS